MGGQPWPAICTHGRAMPRVVPCDGTAFHLSPFPWQSSWCLSPLTTPSRFRCTIRCSSGNNREKVTAQMRRFMLTCASGGLGPCIGIGANSRPRLGTEFAVLVRGAWRNAFTPCAILCKRHARAPCWESGGAWCRSWSRLRLTPLLPGACHRGFAP